jgi:putative solute:sodium symporter small subunit
MDVSKQKAYWNENLVYIIVLLSIWFFVSFVCGIMAADELDAIRIGGFKLGFWFANQGSMVIFVVLIWVYVWLMNRLDLKYDVHEGD